MVRIFESGDYWYISGNRMMYNTYKEAKMANDKIAVLLELQEFANILNGLEDFLDYINANGYGQGHTNAFTDDDVREVKGVLVAADAFNMLNCLTQVNTTITNGSPTPADFGDIIDKFRGRSS